MDALELGRFQPIASDSFAVRVKEEGPSSTIASLFKPISQFDQIWLADFTPHVPSGVVGLMVSPLVSRFISEAFIVMGRKVVFETIVSVLLFCDMVFDCTDLVSSYGKWSLFSAKTFFKRIACIKTVGIRVYVFHLENVEAAVLYQLRDRQRHRLRNLHNTDIDRRRSQLCGSRTHDTPHTSLVLVQAPSYISNLGQV
uniref:Uncharacterized protein n=1 Tax=Parascaris equorum TaxID=6256 RepID=A0A914RR47_PAREQ